MASFNVLSSRTSTVEVPVPVPVIIYTGMDLRDWKNCFIQKKNEAATTAEKNRYNECLKILLYAELCNAELVKVGISRPQGSLAVKFTFEFNNPDCQKAFHANAEILSVVSQTI